MTIKKVATKRFVRIHKNDFISSLGLKFNIKEQPLARKITLKQKQNDGLRNWTLLVTKNSKLKTPISKMSSQFGKIQHEKFSVFPLNLQVLILQFIARLYTLAMAHNFTLKQKQSNDPVKCKMFWRPKTANWKPQFLKDHHNRAESTWKILQFLQTIANADDSKFKYHKIEELMQNFPSFFEFANPHNSTFCMIKHTSTHDHTKRQNRTTPPISKIPSQFGKIHTEKLSNFLRNCETAMIHFKQHKIKELLRTEFGTSMLWEFCHRVIWGCEFVRRKAPPITENQIENAAVQKDRKRRKGSGNATEKSLRTPSDEIDAEFPLHGE